MEYKRLYKSSTDKAIFGVCGGIAEYFGIDSLIVRLVLVLFTLAFGAGLLFYIIAALIMPKRPEDGGPQVYPQPPEPGAYNVRLLYFQATGGAALDFCVKEGEFEDYENFTLDGFSLVGTAASGVAHVGAWAGHVSTDVSAAMLNVTNALDWKATFALDAAPASDDAFRLKVRYADGFTAKVNGTVVTNVLVEEARVLADALTPVVIPIPSELLTVGDNLLEITAVNDAVNDPDFLLSAEVSVTKSAEELVFFREPTPGTKNTSAGYGPASPKVSFSVPHGYKTAARRSIRSPRSRARTT